MQKEVRAQGCHNRRERGKSVDARHLHQAKRREKTVDRDDARENTAPDQREQRTARHGKQQAELSHDSQAREPYDHATGEL